MLDTDYQCDNLLRMNNTLTATETIQALAPDTQYVLSGNTYPHRDELRAMGGEWNAATKTWAIWTSSRRVVWGRELTALTLMVCDGVIVTPKA